MSAQYDGDDFETSSNERGEHPQPQQQSTATAPTADTPATETTQQLQHPLATAIRQGELISQEELKTVQSQLDTQDKIIVTLEQDNKRLHKEHKTMMTKMRDTERANSRLEAKIVLQNTGGGGVTADGVTNSLVGVANSGAGGLGGDAGASNVEQREETIAILNAKVSELTAVNHQLQVREAELRVEYDSLRKEKKDLDRKLATLDPGLAKEAELEAREAKVEMQRAKNQYNEELDDMLRKVAWYVDHQETNRAQEDLLKSQQQTINDLRVKLAELEGYTKVGPGAPATEKDRRMRLLERRIVELESSIRDQNPNSIPELIRACRPGADESKRNKVLHTKIAHLEKELEEHEGNATRMLDRLRVESDGLRAQYQQRVEQLEDDMKSKILNAQSRKVKELEKQLADSKRYYGGKVKDLEASILTMRRQPGGGGTARTTPRAKASASPARSQGGRGGGGSATPPPTVEPHHHQHQHEDPNAHQPEDGQQPLRSTGAGGNSSATTNAAQLAAFQQLHMQQQMELMRVLRERDEIQLRLREVEVKVHRVEEHDDFTNRELAATKRERDEAMAVANQMRAGHASLEHRIDQLRADHRRGLEAMRAQFLTELAQKEQGHAKEVQMLKDTQKTFDFFSPPQSTAAQRFLLGEGGEEGGHAQRGSTQDEVRQYLKLVAQRLGHVEQQQQAREAESLRQLEEVKAIAAQEIQVEKQRMNLALQAKDNEIYQFRLQLDNLLADIAMLHQHSSAGGSGGLPLSTAEKISTPGRHG